ncbi:MAG TPA: AAA family ATPase, partial [Candidatus Baltobacteraceae bacterium]|nr:AAA family ATPase [Candidatus Baltobacteraceae bacterium]
MLSADPVQPLMTTTEIVAIEDALNADARRLAATASGITPSEIDVAIRSYEQQEASRRDYVFRLSDEQRASLQQLSRASLVAIEGLPGVGKTTIQGAVRVLGEQLGRDVVGLTLSQAAAERLESEAGFRCVNTARARILEEGNNPVIPHNGIVVVDEAAMVDSRANGKILEL